MRQHGVRHLLMGGQACVYYGGAEFSRDVDVVLLADADNLDRLHTALQELDATVVAVPPFEQAWLLKGHAVHFRCRADAAAGIRLDVMSTLRGVAPFPELWERRTTLETDEFAVDLLSLPDLVAAKKTQRDKDWPMIRRLLEADYFRHRDAPSDLHAAFWLRELRTPELLRELVAARPADARAAASVRPLLGAALRDDLAGIERGLMEEQERERERDRQYWRPLRAELEQLRHKE